MADTATYAGAMGSQNIGPGGRGVASRRVAKKRGDKRPGSLRAGAPLPVARSAAQRRIGILAYRRPGLKPRP